MRVMNASLTASTATKAGIASALHTDDDLFLEVVIVNGRPSDTSSRFPNLCACSAEEFEICDHFLLIHIPSFIGHSQVPTTSW